MGPFVQGLADAQQEHDRPSGLEVPTEQGDGDGSGVQDGHLDVTLPQAAQPSPQVTHRPEQGQRSADGQGDDGAVDDPAAQGEEQLVLILPVQRPPTVLRRQCLGVLVTERGQGGEHRVPLAVIEDHGVAGAVIDLGVGDTG